MTKLADLAIRPMRDDDTAFVFASWLTSYRQSPKVRNLPNGAYYKTEHSHIECLLARPSVRVLVGVNKLDESQIFGWLCAENFVGRQWCAHFAFVKSSHRRIGILRELLADLQAEPPLHFSAWTQIAPTIANRIGATFSPYLAETSHEEAPTKSAAVRVDHAGPHGDNVG